MAITTVQIPNPKLLVKAYDFRSVTEYKDLPRKADCLEDEDGNGIYGIDPNYFCQTGCDENGFMYIVEKGDKIPLQFRAPDSFNFDPLNPVFGWQNDAGFFLVSLEVLDMSGVVQWSGNISEIAQKWDVSADEKGPFQNVVVDSDLVTLKTGLECFYFRVKVIVATLPALSVNSIGYPVEPPEIGYRILVLATNKILEWNGTEWDEIGPNEIGDVYYVASDGGWYTWGGAFFNYSETPPTPIDPLTQFDYLTTIAFRFAKCNETVVHFRAIDSGIDCSGYNHDQPPFTWLMDPIPGVIFASRYIEEGELLEDQTDLPVGAVVIVGNGAGFAIRRTVSGWETIQPINEGDRFLIMESGSVPAGTIIERGPWVPFVGYWFNAGDLAALYPSAVFNNQQVSAYVFQHDFKVLGSVEVEQFPLTREMTTNGRLIRRTTGRRARLRTTGIPQVVAERVRSVMAAKTFYVNETEWNESDGISKNNDDGLHWWIDGFIGREDCSMDAGCE